MWNGEEKQNECRSNSKRVDNWPSYCCRSCSVSSRLANIPAHFNPRTKIISGSSQHFWKKLASTWNSQMLFFYVCLVVGSLSRDPFGELKSPAASAAWCLLIVTSRQENFNNLIICWMAAAMCLIWKIYRSANLLYSDFGICITKNVTQQES